MSQASPITHHCMSKRLAEGEFSGGRQVPCNGYRTADGEFHLTCGEPCRWGMQKLGEGFPPWTEKDVADRV